MIAAKNNPFTSARVEALLRYDPAWIGESWPAIFERLEALSWRAAVVGPHGSGKTTFLETLQAELEVRGTVVEPLFVNRQSQGALPPEFFASLGPASVILFDGAEQLSGLAWRRFLRKTSGVRGIIISGHRGGRLPTVIETRVTPEILLRCIRRLDRGHEISLEGAQGLLDRHRGNVRHALLECYDRVADGGGGRPSIES